MLRFLRSPPIALSYFPRGCFHSSTARFPDNSCDRLANASPRPGRCDGCKDEIKNINWVYLHCRQALAGTTGRGKTVEEAGVPIASGLLR